MQRNPNIKLYALAWSYPGFLGGESGNWPYANPNKTASYIVNWIQGAKEHYKLDIDYVGVSKTTTQYLQCMWMVFRRVLPLVVVQV